MGNVHVVPRPPKLKPAVEGAVRLGNRELLEDVPDPKLSAPPVDPKADERKTYVNKRKLRKKEQKSKYLHGNREDDVLPPKREEELEAVGAPNKEGVVLPNEGAEDPKRELPVSRPKFGVLIEVPRLNPAEVVLGVLPKDGVVPPNREEAPKPEVPKPVVEGVESDPPKRLPPVPAKRLEVLEGCEAPKSPVELEAAGAPPIMSG